MENIEGESKVRKRWMLSFVFAYALYILLGITESFESSSFGEGFAEFLGYLFGVSVVLGSLYHCAYKERGHRFIGVYSFIILAAVVGDLSYLVKFIDSKSFELNTFLGFCIFLCIKLFFWVNSIFLYQINAKRKKCLAVSPA